MTTLSAFISMASATIGILPSIFRKTPALFSVWRIPEAIKKDEELRTLEERFNDLDLHHLAEEVNDDRAYRLARSYYRELTGKELESSFQLIGMATFLILWPLGAAVEIFFGTGIGIALMIVGAIISVGSFPMSRYFSKDTDAQQHANRVATSKIRSAESLEESIKGADTKAAHQRRLDEINSEHRERRINHKRKAFSLLDEETIGEHKK